MATGLVQVLADATADGFSVLGMDAARWRAVGTIANADDADGPLVSMSTGDGAGSRASIASGEAFYQRRWGSVVTLRVKTSASIANMRLVVGLSSAPGAKQQTPTSHMACFVYDTTAHGTAFWRAITSDGSGTLTTAVTTSAIATSTLYDLRLDMSDGANVKFYVDGTLAATNTTNLPTSTEPMRCGVWLAQLAAGAS